MMKTSRSFPSLRRLLVFLCLANVLLLLSPDFFVTGFVVPLPVSKSNTRIHDATNRKSVEQKPQQRPLTIQSLSSSSSSTHENNNENGKNFDRMSSLIQRLDDLESSAPDILSGFYEPHLTSFSVLPGSGDRLSITSTCFSLLAIQNSPSVFDSIVSFQQQNLDNNNNSIDDDDCSDDVICIPKVIKALLASKWREEDLFQVPLLLYTILTVDQDRSMILQSASSSEEVASKIRKLVTAVLKARPMRRAGSRQMYSDYIIYLICRVLALLQETTNKTAIIPSELEEDFVSFCNDNENSIATNTNEEAAELGVGGLPVNALPDGAAAEISLALARCAEASSNELCRQLAYRAAGDTTEFDVVRLAYSLLTYIQSTQSLCGIAGRELVPGQGVSPGTQVPPLNRRLVIAGLDAFFAEQNNKDGLWEKGQPIYQSFRRQGLSVGNAFVFDVDTLGSLLRTLPAEYFRPHLSSLEKVLTWIEGQQLFYVIPDFCDTESGECYGKALRGWSSPHLRPAEGPQAWSTAQVLTCVSQLKTTIRQLMHRDVLEEFKGIAFSKRGVRPESWDRLLDSDLGSAVAHRTIKSVLEERVILPFSNSIDNPSYGAVYSAILHGPPGTAKTTICESLAQRMGYDFLVIDTAAFLADGLSNVASRIRYVFSRLMALQDTIILFDEIEEFALNRETPGLAMESRMLTTSMLTAINDLRRTKQSIFFVATNRLRAFDSAITRPGRFDMQLFVGTPNLEARCVQLQKQLSGIALTPSESDEAMKVYRTFLESVWTQDAMYMNFLEGMQFASACANLIDKSPKKELDMEQMSVIMAQQAAVMTVRGAVREEYIESMKLSRV